MYIASVDVWLLPCHVLIEPAINCVAIKDWMELNLMATLVRACLLLFDSDWVQPQSHVIFFIKQYYVFNL